jgi:hypothetical protein
MKASIPALNNIPFPLFREFAEPIAEPMLNDLKRTLADG